MGKTSQAPSRKVNSLLMKVRPSYRNEGLGKSLQYAF